MQIKFEKLWNKHLCLCNNIAIFLKYQCICARRQPSNIHGFICTLGLYFSHFAIYRMPSLKLVSAIRIKRCEGWLTFPAFFDNSNIQYIVINTSNHTDFMTNPVVQRCVSIHAFRCSIRDRNGQVTDTCCRNRSIGDSSSCSCSGGDRGRSSAMRICINRSCKCPTESRIRNS